MLRPTGDDCGSDRRSPHRDTEKRRCRDADSNRSCSSLAEAMDEALDPNECLFYLFERCGIASADVSGALVAKGRTGDDGDALLEQQSFGKRNIIEAGGIDPRKGIEGTERLKTWQADPV